MFATRASLGSVILLFTVFALSCASKPEQESRLAQKAMDEAAKVQSADFAPGDWTSATQVWNEAQIALAKQRWGEARTLLLRAKSRFEKARDISRGKREDMTREIEGMQRTIASRYNNLKYGIMNTKLPIKKQKALVAACSDIDNLQAKLKTSLDAGKLLEARAAGQDALKRIYDAEKLLGLSGKGAPDM